MTVLLNMESRVRASPEQLLTLLQYMETHGDLARPLGGPQGRLRSDRLWSELTNMLNSMDGGVSKSTDKWKKVWADWKSKTKKKGLAIRYHVRGTGGGPASNQTLSIVEERVLAIMRNLAVEGQASIGELGFTGSQSQDESNVIEAQEEALCYLEILHEPPTLTLAPSSAQSLPAGPFPATPSPPASPVPAAPSPPASPVPAAPSPPTPPVPAVPSPPAPPGPAAPFPRAPAATTPRQRPVPSAASPPPATRRARSPATPQPSERPRMRARRLRPLTPFERAAHAFAAVEQRRLELEERRMMLQHERDMRALDVEQARNEILRGIGAAAQDIGAAAQDVGAAAREWINYIQSLANTERLNTE